MATIQIAEFQAVFQGGGARPQLGAEAALSHVDTFIERNVEGRKGVARSVVRGGAAGRPSLPFSSVGPGTVHIGLRGLWIVR